MIRTTIVLLALMLTTSSAAFAQFSGRAVNTQPQKQSGPRFGVTAVSGELADRLRDEVDVAPVFTQFGWQFETQIFTAENGLTGVTEWILLAGGMEQGTLLPSASWIVGLRSPAGYELGVGPNLSAAGIALAFGAGLNIVSGPVNFPFNLGVVPSRDGIRVSLLAGFNRRR
jgi:hypothetical protein